MNYSAQPLHLPNGYEIRDAQLDDAAAIAAVHVKAWQTTYAGIIEQSYLDTLSINQRLKLRKKILDKNIDIHLVATFNGKIIAFYDAGRLLFHENQNLSDNQLKSRKERGEIYAIYILQDHQHLGIGKAMFQIGSNKLKKSELTPFIAWVLKDNHQAIKFYAAMGGKLVDETSVIIGDKHYTEIAYKFS